MIRSLRFRDRPSSSVGLPSRTTSHDDNAGGIPGKFILPEVTYNQRDIKKREKYFKNIHKKIWIVKILAYICTRF